MLGSWERIFEMDPVVNTLRLLSEDCSSFQGFMITHSIGGGTGSGFTANLLEKLAVEYGKPKTGILIFIFKVFGHNSTSILIFRFEFIGKKWHRTTFIFQLCIESLISSNLLLDHQQTFPTLWWSHIITFYICITRWSIRTVALCLIMKHYMIYAIVL